MLKTIYLKIIATIFIGTFLSSCNSKKENFDIDLTNYKVPAKNKVKISNENKDIDSSSEKDIIENKLLTYEKKTKVLNSTLFGKKDPFSDGRRQTNKLNSNLKLTGFLNTEISNFVFVSYQNKEGTITEESIGGINTNLLPEGAKVIKVDPKNMKLIINYENENFTFEM